MSLCRTFRAVSPLAVDAIEALAFLVDFDDVADAIWAACGRGGGNDVSQGAEPSSGAFSRTDSRDHTTSSPAHGSAGDDRPSRSVPDPRDVEREGLPNLTFYDVINAAMTVRQHAERTDEKYWTALADRLVAAADAMK